MKKYFIPKKLITHVVTWYIRFTRFSICGLISSWENFRLLIHATHWNIVPHFPFFLTACPRFSLLLVEKKARQRVNQKLEDF